MKKQGMVPSTAFTALKTTFFPTPVRALFQDLILIEKTNTGTISTLQRLSHQHQDCTFKAKHPKPLLSDSVLEAMEASNAVIFRRWGWREWYREERGREGKRQGILDGIRQIQNDFINTLAAVCQKDIFGKEYCTDVGVCWWGASPVMLCLQSPK